MENRYTQKMRVFEFLQHHIATTSMITEATGIPQKSITWVKRDFQKSGTLMEVYKKPCMITGRKAAYLTTNPRYFPKSNQIELFNSLGDNQ